MAILRSRIQFRAELDGVDITDYLLPDANLSIARSRDYPDATVFKASGINIPLINTSVIFDPGENPNFLHDKGAILQDTVLG